MNPQPSSAGNVHLYLYINSLFHGLPQLVVYIFIYTFFHRHPVFFFCISFSIRVFSYFAFDGCGLLRKTLDSLLWNLLFLHYHFFAPRFGIFCCGLIAVDCLGLFRCGFSFPQHFFFYPCFLPFPFHCSSSVFLSAAETNCCGDFPLFS